MNYVVGILLATNCVFATNIILGGVFQGSDNIDEVVFEAGIDLINRKSTKKFESLKISLQPDEIIDAKKGETIDVVWNDPFGAMQTVCSMLPTGVVGVFNLLKSENSYAVQSLCDAKEIPVVQTKSNFRLEQEWYSINLFPHAPVLARAFADLVTYWNWKSFTVIYEHQDQLPMIAEMLKLDYTSNYKVTVRQLSYNKDGNYLKDLKSVRDSGQVNFILDCSTKNLGKILSQLQIVGLMMEDYSYIILNLDMHTIDLLPYEHSNANLTFMRLFDTSSSKIVELNKSVGWKKNKTGFMNKDREDRLSTSSVLLIDGMMLFADVFRRYKKYQAKVLFCNQTDSWEHGSTLFNFMKTKVTNGLTGRIEFNQHGFRSEFSLDVVEMTDQGVSQIGYWTSRSGLKMRRHYPETVLPPGSLHNVSIIISICIVEPYAMLKTSSALLTGNDRYEGFSMDLIHEMSKLEGFIYTFVKNADDRNGNYNATTDTWDGMMGDVIFGDADLAIGDLTITRQRKQYVDFTSPFMALGIQILYTKPTIAVPGFFSFAGPFHTDVWLLILITIPLMSTMFFLIGRICPDEWYNPHECLEEPRYLINQYDFTTCVWFILANLTQEGADVAPRGLSTRVLTAFWSYFILVIVSSYTANMTAFLTSEKEIWPFTNVEELAARGAKLGLKYGAVGNGTTHKFFLESEDKDIKVFGDFMRNNPQYMKAHYEEGVEEVIDSKDYVFFMESSSIKYVTERQCSLTAVGNFLDHKFYGIAMKKGSMYRNKLSATILKLIENGKVDDLHRKWWEKERGGGECMKTKSNTAPPLNHRHLSGIFWITFMGIFFAIVLVFLEFLYGIIKKYKRLQKIFTQLKRELKFYLKFNKFVKKVQENEET